MIREITFQDLSPAEKQAAETAMLEAMDSGIGFTAQQAWPLAFSAGWLAARMWMLDHLVAMSSEQPQAILDVAIPATSMDMSMRVWEALWSAVCANMLLADRDKAADKVYAAADALDWLDEHRP